MRSRWNAKQAARAEGLLELRAYGSRLLGSDPALVLHGGGNTSVKDELADYHGTRRHAIHVKGSGRDLAQVQAQDFATLWLDPVRSLADQPDMDNATLMAHLGSCLARSGGPRPSIETLLHALLPAKYVEHTHADSILAITNTVSGKRICAEVFGELAPSVPFAASGAALAHACWQVFQREAGSNTIGLILLHHGVFAFGETAQDSYENMLRLVTLAEDYLRSRAAWTLPRARAAASAPDLLELARLRHDLSEAAGFPLLLALHDDAASLAFARRSDLHQLALQGPPTPQHAVFAKRVPLLGRDVAAYVKDYEAYVAAARPGATPESLGLDSAPRVLLDPLLGILCAGINAHFAEVTWEIFRQDVEILSRAAAHDRYLSLPPGEILDAEVHYGGFERQLREAPHAVRSLLGESALVTGAGTDFGQALVRAFAGAGCCVSAVDAAGAWQEALPAGPDCRGHACAGGHFDRTVAQAHVRRAGGLDLLVILPGFESWIEPLAAVLELSPRGPRVICLGAQAPASGPRLTRLRLEFPHASQVLPAALDALALAVVELAQPALAGHCLDLRLET